MFIIIIVPILIAWTANSYNAYHHPPKNPLIDEAVVKYYDDIHTYLVDQSVDKEYLDKLENIRFRVIPLDQESAVFEDNVKSSKIGEKVVARCDQEYDMIIIRESLLKEKDDYIVQEAIDHEIGHCVFKRIHAESHMIYETHNLPKSIMNPYNIGFYNDTDLKKLYRHELIDSSTFHQFEKIQEYTSHLKKENKSKEEIEILVAARMKELGNK